MNRPWTTSEFGRAAESARENFFASISWDAMTRWFASGRLRDSPGPGSCGGAARNCSPLANNTDRRQLWHQSCRPILGRQIRPTPSELP